MFQLQAVSLTFKQAFAGIRTQLTEMTDVSSTNLLLLLRDNHIINENHSQRIKVCELFLQFCVFFCNACLI